MNNHFKRAAKAWVCKACEGAIEKGERHFCVLGTTLPYGRFIGTMVEARYHLRCMSPTVSCCKQAEAEMAEEVLRAVKP